MMPRQSEVEIPLLQVLEALGGQGITRNIYPLVTQKFPQMTQDDLDEKLISGASRWENRIQWARQKLVDKGEMCSPQRGIWAITEKGRNRLLGIETLNGDGNSSSTVVSLVEIYDEFETGFRNQLLDKLHELTPQEFEIFAKKLLTVYGFVRMEVTSLINDGGIDGHGFLKVGLARMNVAFQCKRWSGNVPRTEVDKFRGAIQGEYEQGLFFTTSDFTEGAKLASIKKGAVPIILLNGESIVDLMIEKQFGVRRRPLELLEDQVDTLFSEDK